METSFDTGAALDVRCPVCGSSAEAGCIYGVDKNFLYWQAGEPNWKNNLKSAFGFGEVIGDSELGAGVYIQGIRCRSCHHIVLKLPDKP